MGFIARKPTNFSCEDLRKSLHGFGREKKWVVMWDIPQAFSITNGIPRGKDSFRARLQLGEEHSSHSTLSHLVRKTEIVVNKNQCFKLREWEYCRQERQEGTKGKKNRTKENDVNRWRHGPQDTGLLNTDRPNKTLRFNHVLEHPIGSTHYYHQQSWKYSL